MDIDRSFYINEIPLFDTLTVEQSKKLEKCLIFKELSPGTVVYKEGSHGSSVCFVAEGLVQVLKNNGAGQDVVIAELSKGQSLGEVAIIDGMTRSATVKALTAAKVFMLKREDFERVVNEDPQIGVKILRSLGRSLSTALRERSEELARLLLG